MSVLAEPSWTLGIEEEYLLVDKRTGELVSDPPEALMLACEAALPGQVTAEFLRSQIEVGTRVCTSMQEARKDLAVLRRTVADVSGEFGIAPIAASTHPFADWAEQKHTPKERYDTLLKDMAGAARRMLICGMHVHVAVEDPELRIDLMNQVSYFLPHLLALSTSSPFWQGEDMGVMSYRTIVFDALPRTGLPPRFAGASDFDAYVSQLVNMQIVGDGTKLWWDTRPSARFPTLEMRITDVCTRLEDCIAVASVYRCLLRMLYRQRRENRTWRLYPLQLINENRWRALRYGADGDLLDFGRGEKVPYKDLVEEMIGGLAEDAEGLGCTAELEHIRTIVRRGSSAHRQLHVFNAALQDGADREEALRDVVDHLIRETVEGL